MTGELRTAEFPFEFYPDHWGIFPIHEIFPLQKSLPALDVEHYQICVTPSVSQRTTYLGFDDFAPEWPIDPDMSARLRKRRDKIRGAAKFRALVRVKRVKDLLPEGIERLRDAGADVSDAACKERALVVAITGDYHNFPMYKPSPEIKKNLQVQYIHNFGGHTRERDLHLVSIDARTFVRCMLYIERIKLRHFMVTIHKEEHARTPVSERTVRWFVQQLMEKYPFALTARKKTDSYRGARKHTSEIRHAFVCHAEWLLHCTNLANGPDPVISRRVLERWAEKAPRKRELAARDGREGWGVWDAQWDKEDPGKQYKKEKRRLRYFMTANKKKAVQTDSDNESDDDMHPEYNRPSRKRSDRHKPSYNKHKGMRPGQYANSESSDSGGLRGNTLGKGVGKKGGYGSPRRLDKGKGKAAEYKHSWVKVPKKEHESSEEEDDGGVWETEEAYASLDDNFGSSKRHRPDTYRPTQESSPSLGGGPGGERAQASSPSLGGGPYPSRSPGARGTQRSSPSLGGWGTQRSSPSLGARGTQQSSQSLGGWGAQKSAQSFGGRGNSSSPGRPSRRPEPGPSWRPQPGPSNKTNAGTSSTQHRAGAGAGSSHRPHRGASSLEFVAPTPTSVARQFSQLQATESPKKTIDYITISSDADDGDDAEPAGGMKPNVDVEMKRSSSSVIDLRDSVDEDHEMRERSDVDEEEDEAGAAVTSRNGGRARPPARQSKPRRSYRLTRRASESDSEEQLSESQGSMNSSDSESKYGRSNRGGPDPAVAVKRKLIKLNDTIRRFAPAVFYLPDLPTSWSAWRCTLPVLDMPLTTDIALAHEHKCTFVLDLADPSEHVLRLLIEVSPELAGHLKARRFRWVDEEIPTSIFLHVVDKHWQEHHARWGVKKVISKGYMHFEEL